MAMYPFKFEPIFKERIWGGQKLREVFGKDIQPFSRIGESWELADLPHDKSVIVNGVLAGTTLAEAIARYPKEIMGDASFSGEFPLLIKFLDAEDVLSVQVHPDAETCQRMGRGEPKTECWYVISAAEGAVLYKGVKEGVNREMFAEAVKTGEVEKLLCRVAVSAGECHFLPAGTAHAIGAGLLIAEIQLPSDTTYRVFDWNRLDDSQKPRQLHIEEALESIHFDVVGDRLPVTTAGRLVDCEYFRVEKAHQAKNSEVLVPGGQMRVIIMIGGSGTLVSDGGGAEFKAGDTVLLPAEYEGAIRFGEETDYLRITVPKDKIA